MTDSIPQNAVGLFFVYSCVISARVAFSEAISRFTSSIITASFSSHSSRVCA